ncbi:MAG: hypothetical protein JO100_00020 [Pseudonocardia sp.]|nr:hypothetical protein [Pseudonocardia sp.]
MSGLVVSVFVGEFGSERERLGSDLAELVLERSVGPCGGFRAAEFVFEHEDFLDQGLCQTASGYAGPPLSKVYFVLAESVVS